MALRRQTTRSACPPLRTPTQSICCCVSSCADFASRYSSPCPLLEAEAAKRAREEAEATENRLLAEAESAARKAEEDFLAYLCFFRYRWHARWTGPQSLRPVPACMREEELVNVLFNSKDNF